MEDQALPQVEHKLVIKSLRDIDAVCSCGKWSMSGPSFDSDSSEVIRERINEQYKFHPKN